MVGQFVGSDWIASLPSHFDFSVGALSQKDTLKHHFTGLPRPCGGWKHAIAFKQTLHDSGDFSKGDGVGTKRLSLRHVQMLRNHELFKQSLSVCGHFVMILDEKIAVKLTGHVSECSTSANACSSAIWNLHLLRGNLLLE